VFMKVSKEPQINDEEIYYDLLLMIAEVEGTDVIAIADTENIPLALARLRLDIGYRMLDYDATVRERDYLKSLLENNGKKS